MFGLDQLIAGFGRGVTVLSGVVDAAPGSPPARKRLVAVAPLFGVRALVFGAVYAASATAP